MNTEGNIEGEICNRSGCQGVVCEHDVEGCTCHISPPCAACVEPRGYCKVCDWDVINDPAPVHVVDTEKPSKVDCVFHSPMKGIPVDRRKTLSVSGVTYTHVHSGQKRSYGGRHDDYIVTSELPVDDVRKVCTEIIHKCDLSTAQWRHQDKMSEGAHFRHHYSFSKTGEREYLYCVRFPSTF